MNEVNKKLYELWIETTEREQIKLTRLTERQAERLNSLLDKHIDWSTARAFGWREMK